MEAEKKLRGATYHLQRMKETYLQNDEYFTYELEAFLVKARSVPDVLLEDFNQKFSLGISLEQKLFPNTFEKEARKQRNNQALNFIKWWNVKISKIQSAPIGFIFFGKRNISVHRKEVAPNLKTIMHRETIRYAESVAIEKYDEKGKLCEEWKSSENLPQQIEPKPAEMDWFFEDYPSKNVLEACKEILETIEDLVDEAKKVFI